MSSKKLKEVILVVDDDIQLQQLLTKYLTEQGYITSAIGDGKAMDHWLEQNEADLIILDLMLPGEDGLSIARRLHSQSSIGILMVSARSEDIDRIIGLEVGADDYLAKPFNPRELLARIRALNRRQKQLQIISSEQCVTRKVDTKNCFGPFRIDFDAHMLFRNEKPITLTHSEYELLSLLLKNPNRVLSRDMLIENLQGYE